MKTKLASELLAKLMKCDYSAQKVELIVEYFNKVEPNKLDEIQGLLEKSLKKIEQL